VANIIQVYPGGYSPKIRLKDRDYPHAFGIKGKALLGFGYDLSTPFPRTRSTITRTR